LAIDVLEPSALLIVCQVLDGALLTRLRGVKPGIGGAANVRFCLGAAEDAGRSQSEHLGLGITRSEAAARHGRPPYAAC